jgi:hypothetical protein
MAIQVSPAEPNGAEAALPAAATGAAPLDAGPEPLDAGPSEFWAEPRNAEAPRSAQGAHSAP